MVHPGNGSGRRRRGAAVGGTDQRHAHKIDGVDHCSGRDSADAVGRAADATDLNLRTEVYGATARWENTSANGLPDPCRASSQGSTPRAILSTLDRYCSWVMGANGARHAFATAAWIAPERAVDPEQPAG